MVTCGDRLKNGGLKAFVSSLPFLLFTALGWLLFTIGFGWLDAKIAASFDSSNSDNLLLNFTPFYFLALSAPFAVITYTAYMLTGIWALGSLSLISSAIAIASGGATTYLSGLSVSVFTKDLVGGEVSINSLPKEVQELYSFLVLAFVGALFTTIGLMVSVLMVPVMNRFCHSKILDATPGYRRVQSTGSELHTVPAVANTQAMYQPAATTAQVPQFYPMQTMSGQAGYYPATVSQVPAIYSE